MLSAHGYYKELNELLFLKSTIKKVHVKSYVVLTS